MSDVAGWRERLVEGTPTKLSDLKAQLADADPALGEALRRPGVQVAIDKVIVRDNPSLAVGAEVAFLAPMSGG
ncbi:MAG: MoaD/ThiS family protein [Caulobacteraceae bacterium]